MGNEVESSVSEVERRVIALMLACDRALSERRSADAERAFREAQSLLPDHPTVSYEQSRRLYAAGNPRGARDLLEKAVSAAPREARYWHGLAAVLRVLVLNEEELAALDGALKIEPRDAVALLYKGAVLDRMGKRRAASRIYSNALQVIASGGPLPPAMEPLLREARQRVQAVSAEFTGYVDRRLGASAPGSFSIGRRANRFVDLMLDRAQRYVPQPTGLYFPNLRNYEFYDREQCPWLEALEAATDDIREECLAVLGQDEAGLEPYVAYRDGLPLDQWKELNNSRRWSAYFLWKESARIESHLSRCPKTEAALSAIPRVDIPGFGPTAFFSILDGKTRIPPHHGVTNTRLTVHLPLVIPPGCAFRVGNDTRPWKVGEGWAFDDTIEHEAWNDSDVPRAILIFDVWNPELSVAERDMVREATLTFAEFFDVEGMEGIGL
jgi:tetratricopeptide (TPR) repeat protein